MRFLAKRDDVEENWRRERVGCWVRRRRKVSDEAFMVCDLCCEPDIV